MDQVDFYIIGMAQSHVYFPNGQICCRWCRYCRHKDTGQTRRTVCTMTYEPIVDIDARGRDCPLTFTGEIVEKKGREP